ncbi:MAG TPA: hypothetical protein VLD63_13305 [Anaerolineales bacterium]|nr:hypothetical protein [Anaerolineales bacterium]
MNRSTLRIVIAVLGLITAFVHGVLLNMSMGKVDVLFTLNALGYLALVAAFFFNPSIVSGRRRLLSYAFMAFTAVTIVAWVAIGQRSSLGYLTKVDELLLIVALALNLKNES